LPDSVFNGIINSLATKVFELASRGNPMTLIEEPGATKVRLETKAMLKKAGKVGNRLLDYFMREQVAQAALAVDGSLVMTEKQATYAKRWVEAQLDCRRHSWPSDAENKIEVMEVAIRKAVNRHLVSESRLKDATHFYRENSGGWYAFGAARKNALSSGAIRLTGRTRRGVRAYCPGTCKRHPSIKDEDEPKLTVN
jgi:hypothetical protein